MKSFAYIFGNLLVNTGWHFVGITDPKTTQKISKENEVF